MKPSPEADAAADAKPAGGDAGSEGSRARDRGRFLYRTGDRPLEGYTIKRGVGRGGFGEVYFATSDAGKEVALKLIRRNLDVELRGVRQCLNLKHPNLISLYDIRSDESGDEWVVMEFVAGESLEQAIDRNPNGMPVEEALAWFRGVASGVGHLHSCGIVHRDLKPGNLFLERPAGQSPRPEDVRIGDYGLSKFISTSRRSGQTESVGTVHYMAPEIAGGRYGREIDTYALGVILYEMLTGRTPFEGESVGEVLMKHLTAEPDLSRVAEPYRTLISKALTKDPEARIKSVDDMVALLPQPQGEAPSGDAAAPEAVLEPAVVWSPVSRPPHTDHPVPQREPLWQGLVDLCDTARERWSGWNAPPLMKGLVLFGAVMAFIMTQAWLLIAALLPFYFVYYIVWAMFFLRAPAGAPTPTSFDASQQPTALYNAPVTEKPNAKRARQVDWRKIARKNQLDQPFKKRSRSMIGSMIVAGLVATAIAMVAAPFLVADGSADATALGAWLAGVATLGSWAVMVINTNALTRFEDRLPLRGLNTLAGLAVGFGAFAIASTLGLDLPRAADASIHPNDSVMKELFGFDLYASSARNQQTIAVPVAASMVYFGIVFFVLRWWNTIDVVRHRRIGFWSIGWIALVAWMLTLVSYYPQPIGVTTIALIALSAKAASPWLPPSKREAIARGDAVTV